MPVYNAEKYLREAMDSVISQSYTQFDFIIVNDGSTDNSENIINSYKDERIHLVSKPNGGVASALNAGILYSESKYIIRFDADDVCLPDRFQDQINFLEQNPEYVLIGGNVIYMDEAGEFLFDFENKSKTHEEIQLNMLGDCPVVHSSICYKRLAVIEAGLYNEFAFTFEDHLLWTRLINIGKFYNSDKYYIKVRFNAASVTLDAKDYDPALIKLKNKALQSQNINEEEGVKIKYLFSKINNQVKKSSFHRLLAKKYLWNNYNPKLARQNVYIALKFQKLNYKTWILLLLSFLPEGFIRLLYKKVKS